MALHRDVFRDVGPANDPAAIRSPRNARGRAAANAKVGQLPLLAAIRAHGVDDRPAARVVAKERDLPTIGRPGRQGIGGSIRRQPADIRGADALHVVIRLKRRSGALPTRMTSYVRHSEVHPPPASTPVLLTLAASLK
jgi:hypothetical protein